MCTPAEVYHGALGERFDGLTLGNPKLPASPAEDPPVVSLPTAPETTPVPKVLDKMKALLLEAEFGHGFDIKAYTKLEVIDAMRPFFKPPQNTKLLEQFFKRYAVKHPPSGWEEILIAIYDAVDAADPRGGGIQVAAVCEAPSVCFDGITLGGTEFPPASPASEPPVSSVPFVPVTMPVTPCPDAPDMDKAMMFEAGLGHGFGIKTYTNLQVIDVMRPFFPFFFGIAIAILQALCGHLSTFWR